MPAFNGMAWRAQFSLQTHTKDQTVLPVTRNSARSTSLLFTTTAYNSATVILALKNKQLLILTKYI
jgi:hypothetical protein